MSAFASSIELTEALDKFEIEQSNSSIKQPASDNIDELDIMPKTQPDDLEEDESEEYYEPPKKHDWVYLDKDAPDSTLSYEFGLCNESSSKTYKVYICAYQINTDCNSPFIQYLLERSSSSEYNFPYFNFSCPDTISTNSFSFSGIVNSIFGQQTQEPVDELSQGHTYFLNQCLMRILELIAHDEDHEDPDFFTYMYKGFVEHGTDSIYAFFDFTGKSLAETKDIPRSWVIIDEIINEHSTLGYKIAHDIYKMFYANPKLIYIDDKEGYHYDVPSVLYLCKMGEGGEYVNIFQEDPTVFSLYTERIEHPHLGDVFIFSLSPLESSKGYVSQLKRFVGFTPNATYILKDVSAITGVGPIAGEPEFMGFKLPKALFGGPNLEEKKAEEEPESEEEEPESEEEEPESEEEEPESEGEFQDAKSPKSAQLEELQNIDNASIYFKNNGIPYWCLKSKINFTEY